MLGGAFWVAKGGLIMLGGPDPNLLIPAELFFALGLVGLHARLGGRGGWAGKLGGFLAYAAVALSFVNAPYSMFFAEEGPRTPFPFNVTIFVASVAIFAGLVSLGIAGLRTLPPRWSALPLTLGLAAILPVWVLALVHLELPVVLIGLGWVAFGYALWSDGERRTAPRGVGAG